MFNQIKSIQLVNFQSWSDQSKPLEMETDVINIIKGRNETGKSVVFKLLYEMCFPGYHGAEQLVRRGCEYGVLLIVLVNGTQLLFQLFASGSRVFYMQKQGEEDAKVWKQTDMPEEFSTELELLVSYENRIILNVIDKDIPTPFIKTDPHYNAEVFRNILEPAKLSVFFERAKEYQLDLKDTRAILQRKADFYNAKQSALEFVDEHALRVKQTALREWGTAGRTAVTLNNTLVDMYELKQRQGAHLLIDMHLATSLLKIRESLSDLQERNSAYLSMEADSQHESICNAEDLARARQLMHFKSLCTEVLPSIARVAGHTISPYVEITPEVTRMYQIRARLRSVDSVLNDYCTDNACMPDVIDVYGVPKLYMDMRSSLAKTHKALSNVTLVCKQLSDNKREQSALHTEIKNLEGQLGVCPTCGRTFNG
ncbi:MAG: hypothetical protein RSC43_00035 [Clostridia bacterium]